VFRLPEFGYPCVTIAEEPSRKCRLLVPHNGCEL